MVSVLKEFWFGNLRPSEDRCISEQETKLIEQIGEQRDELIKMLNQEQLQVFNNHNDSVDEYISLLESQAFEIGFVLASRIFAKN